MQKGTLPPRANPSLQKAKLENPKRPVIQAKSHPDKYSPNWQTRPYLSESSDSEGSLCLLDLACFQVPSCSGGEGVTTENHEARGELASAIIGGFGSNAPKKAAFAKSVTSSDVGTVQSREGGGGRTPTNCEGTCALEDPRDTSDFKESEDGIETEARNEGKESETGSENMGLGLRGEDSGGLEGPTKASGAAGGGGEWEEQPGNDKN
ncbi:hypothetical protein Nepgr_021136 [Nepenthes gracilis]|uniref:Uncharacterized protein n=1 Tax=Nepenthes gracilis TaxID=150966 RepID=A0AAD3SWQ0_NEPGR|nr:hypothetical protein Nepgr_021136 [Nepenthes gracilis]